MTPADLKNKANELTGNAIASLTVIMPQDQAQVIVESIIGAAMLNISAAQMEAAGINNVQKRE